MTTKSSNGKINKKLCGLMADTYSLYLKTQNYHWHVTGPLFSELHGLFEKNYLALLEVIDATAERIRILGSIAPATFREFLELTKIKEGDSNKDANQMVNELYEDYGRIIMDIQSILKVAQEEDDEGSVSLLSEHLAQHEKSRWMLGVSREKRS